MIVFVAAMLINQCVDFIGPPPSPEIRIAFVMMSAPRWQTREIGMDRLLIEVKTNPRMSKYLADGIGHRDPEIRWRCAKVARKLVPCTGCHGLGVWGDLSNPQPCGQCAGLRHTFRPIVILSPARTSPL